MTIYQIQNQEAIIDDFCKSTIDKMLSYFETR